MAQFSEGTKSCRPNRRSTLAIRSPARELPNANAPQRPAKPEHKLGERRGQRGQSKPRIDVRELKLGLDEAQSVIDPTIEITHATFGHRGLEFR